VTVPASGRRRVCFAGEHVRIEIEFSGDGASRTLAGRLFPPVSARIEIRHVDHVTTVAADSRGRFRVADVPAGRVSVRCHLDAPARQRVVATPWLNSDVSDGVAGSL
jgi:hypothetical protein